MSFLIRAGLVIGVLSWLALQRQGERAPAPPAVADAAAAAWDALPAPLRDAALREGAAEIGRRAFTASPVSRDTLSDSDRKVPWRGAQTHADRATLAQRGERGPP
ncbi:MULTISPECIES: hypothetical protein [unclassified Methylobacterium]|jgi:hypothetical protein|uniref:hypothetical protein n=1 Tax=unclassified Methylobacterium TaxID=2615210 RepID=UPI0006FEF5FD|nr:MULTISPECIES: hypothetical protein [unclassified Methylobacterium]KQO71100.1 hypothetical protein ASF18_01015 [Methylobacterium sp. Leaf89]KQO79288.1 hypothetical protein ASF20_00775 [Methylobacterium sp. Leaf88]KQP76364.1 hypothetical protein ASF41_00755 [Methylobacterium sp. Leaf111]KQT70787.1 hypothetical protein ASG51_11785 [Methylobacterium sp. Leaf465]KQU23816.1 hypothetical protein ASG63_04105 [Methylobacterium sp. Leaf94]